MNKLLNVYKPIGNTPLQIVNHLKEHFPEYKNEKIGYAGRLDPLAHGVLLLMIGDAAKEKDIYLNLSKEYEFEALFGVETDTYDILGYLKELKIKPLASNVNLFVNIFVSRLVGKQKQLYPPYSSKTVLGKPLFWWARNNKLSEIQLPQREIEIYDFTLISFDKISKQQLQTTIHNNISSVTGDFRQKKIQKRWDKFFKETQQSSFVTAKFTLKCSSGTYVRGLVDLLGKELGCGAIAIDILRTKVGEYSISNSLKFEFNN